MAYLGSKPQSGFISNAKERYTGLTTNYVDLNHSIGSLADVIVWVNYVKQDATNLTLTTSTRITLGATLVASDIVEVSYLGKAVATQTPDTGTVTNDMLAGSITGSKLSSTAVDNTNTNSTLITAQTEKSSLVDADKFLISDSAASGALKYVQKSNLGAGSFTLIKTENVTSAASAVNIESIFSTTYDTYLVLIYRYLTSSDSGEARMRFLTGTNTEVSGSAYDYANHYFNHDGTSSSNTGNNGTYFRFADSIKNIKDNGGLNATMWFNVDKNTSDGCAGTYNGTGQFADGSSINESVYMGGLYQDSTSNVSPTGLRFEAGTGNISSVKISAYGVTK